MSSSFSLLKPPVVTVILIVSDPSVSCYDTVTSLPVSYYYKSHGGMLLLITFCLTTIGQLKPDCHQSIGIKCFKSQQVSQCHKPSSFTLLFLALHKYLSSKQHYNTINQASSFQPSFSSITNLSNYKSQKSSSYSHG